MFEITPQPHLGTFQVQVGHMTVTVKGHTQQEAIAAARRRLCLELPRLWDVIQMLDPDRFQVSPTPGEL